MKLAIISTTIRGDQGYRDYDELAHDSNFSDVHFVISGDLQSVEFNSDNFMCNIEYLDVNYQNRYRCSGPIGWKKFARRNISLLRAMELRPDYILTIDDDNRPHQNYFNDWYKVLSETCNRSVTNDSQDSVWHNYLRSGVLEDSSLCLYPRGFPVAFRGQERTSIDKCDPILPNEIGLYQGVSLGDPDIDAMTRIVFPEHEPLKDIKESNYCLQHIWSPYNTQNTMFSKVLFPLAFTWPSAERFEDIYASFAWQQLLFNNDMHVHIGDSMNWQIRGARNDLRDFSLEVEGYLHAHDVWEDIRGIEAKDPIDFIRQMIVSDNEIISKEKEFLEAYLVDLYEIGF